INRQMKEFFKFVFASMLGVILSFFVLILLSIFTIIGIASTVGEESQVEVEDQSVMHLRLDYPITERTSKNPLENLNVFGIESERNIGLNDILISIEKAKTDKKIKGIYIDVSYIQSGYAAIEEIRNKLIDFKKSGKFVLAYSEVYTKGAYYLASAANKVYLNPQGMIDFRGFSTEITFFKGALDKLEIEPQIIKVGTYKSAVEPFILDKMSKANKEQVTSFLGSLYDHYITKIAESRNIPKDSLLTVANLVLVRTAEDGVKYRLVDGLKYKDEVLSELKSLTGIVQSKDLNSVAIADYVSIANEQKSSSSNRIAVVYAVGEIISGEGNDETIGSERISRAIRKARTDKKVKAVVLRINSPGGSALASDVIWREVELTKKVKPVMVSMGDVAASGGYYIACNADSIFAQPNTITGSIGVFGIIPNMQKFFNNKLGITFDGVKTGKFADISITRPLQEDEKMMLQQEINQIYKTFTQKVADGRRKSVSYIDSIGQGRVWSGSEALKNGLVDRLGNIDDAIRAAAKKAKLKEYKIVEFPSQKDPFQEIFETSSDKIRTYFTKQELGDSYIYYQQLKSVINRSGMQARIPFEITVK
ncbi:MAG: signal peptide peptidase SppA, partial [Bacteroidota bacterium]